MDALTLSVLSAEYLSDLKALPYVGNEVYTQTLRPHSRGWYNSLAVFPASSSKRMHGILGVNKEGQPLWTPADMPDPIDAPTV